jgi:hypothetical protein
VRRKWTKKYDLSPVANERSHLDVPQGTDLIFLIFLNSLLRFRFFFFHSSLIVENTNAIFMTGLYRYGIYIRDGTNLNDYVTVCRVNAHNAHNPGQFLKCKLLSEKKSFHRFWHLIVTTIFLNR